MKRIVIAISAIVLLPRLAFAGDIYGTLKENGRPVPAATVQVTCGRTTHTTQTGGSGSYRLYMPATGRCTLTVIRNGRRSAPLPIHSFDNSVRYNLTLRRQANGTYKLERT